MTKKQTPLPPQSGRGRPKPPKKNEVNLIELIDEYVEANKGDKKWTQNEPS